MVEMTGEELLNVIEKGIKEGERLFLFSLAFLVFATVFMCLSAIANDWIGVVLVLVPCCVLSHTIYKTYSILCDLYYEKGEVAALVRLECIVNDR